jgi:hypothetical protein
MLISSADKDCRYLPAPGSDLAHGFGQFLTAVGVTLPLDRLDFGGLGSDADMAGSRRYSTRASTLPTWKVRRILCHVSR